MKNYDETFFGAAVEAVVGLRYCSGDCGARAKGSAIAQQAAC